MERTLIIIKPDGVQRRLVGKIVGRLEDKGIKIVGMKFLRASEQQAAELYKVHLGKPFHPKLVKFITSGPVVVTVVEAVRAIEIVRKLMGETFGFNAQPGTVRGDFAISKGMNVVHGSDSAASAAREIPIFFGPSELASYEMPDQQWIADEKEDAG